jgi:hypothetical protein
MNTRLLASAIAAAASLAMISAASACAPGYKSVKIDGNWVCRIDATSATKIKAKTKPELPRAGGASQIKTN